MAFPFPRAENYDNNVTIYIAGNKSRGANEFGLGMGGVGRTHPLENYSYSK